MYRKTTTIVAAGVLALVLAGCGSSKMTTTKTTYQGNGLVAAVKGHANTKTVSYKIDGAKAKKATVHDNTFVIQVPTTTARQTVKLTAGSDNQTVHIKAAKSLFTYKKLVNTYNNALIASKMTTKQQAAAKKLQTQAASLKKEQATIQANVKKAKAQIAAGGTSAVTGAKTLQAQQTAAAKLQTEAASLQASQKTVAAAMKTAKAKVKDDLLPTKTPRGISNVVTTNDYKLRLNVQSGDVMGAALIVPTTAFKSTTRSKNFGTAFALLASTSGANAKNVTKQFKKETKSNNSSTTTIDPIYSKGVKFSIGVSTSDLYIFMTK
ncbi:hypothetical protein [Lactiplantibacillus fabifermentans]|uniref:Lipoprotein n=2 Tax=Lactiplantibacillus fabifermentans TaxID=483011 RepID=A0A0R2P0J3_9LACO|nr:hypothetical protein [Lactiplantibacillus fabifermentans]ETY73731.1 hypothetical protein LFAB_10805 [Lactiplantibacillus fabifermentans T30PCM01]KRO29341.1 lipoprotein [Lactiplantibacillus fabifermentans DSM 21115]